jgi:hypothetical protein
MFAGLFAVIVLNVYCVQYCIALKLTVGHIGAVHAMPNADKVLEVARQQLVEEGLLDKNLQLE